ncbi:uncharacterized protein VTP21DRAFT_4196 [Calcarisporiella thermophila]|uniref:uncharacterized protein n=1 Tax=Calcarisporiella thermophila TaxID=911321 RepID=UPI0037428006
MTRYSLEISQRPTRGSALYDNDHWSAIRMLREPLIVKCYPLDSQGGVIKRHIVEHVRTLCAHVFATTTDGTIVDHQLVGNRRVCADIVQELDESESAYFYFANLSMRRSGYYHLLVRVYKGNDCAQSVASICTETVYIDP